MHLLYWPTDSGCYVQVICRDVVDVNRAADNGNTPLHVAASFGDEELVKSLLTARGINISVTNSSADGATPLHVAVMHGKFSQLSSPSCI